MSGFLDPCDVRVVSDDGARAQFMVLSRMRYECDFLGVTLEVPAGAMTDGPSIPVLGAALLGGLTTGFRAAVLHDHLCRSRSVPRETADKVFLEALLSTGVPDAQAQSMYAAVRAWSSAQEPYAGEPNSGLYIG